MEDSKSPTAATHNFDDVAEEKRDILIFVVVFQMLVQFKSIRFYLYYCLNLVFVKFMYLADLN